MAETNEGAGRKGRKCLQLQSIGMGTAATTWPCDHVACTTTNRLSRRFEKENGIQQLQPSFDSDVEQTALVLWSV